MEVSRREFIGAAGAVAALTLSPRITRLIAESMYRVQEGQRPNIVVLLTDDQDTASLPVMRKLMALPYGDWIQYTHAYTNEARCCPSRGAMLTGQYSHHHGVEGNGRGEHLDGTNTIATWLQEAGYHTGFIGKYFIGWPKLSRPPGWNFWSLRGNTVDEDIELAENFMLDGAATGKPFFLLLAFTAPHAVASPGRYAGIDPYVPPDSPNYNEADVSDKPAVIRRQNFSPETQSAWRKERANAQRELLMIDDGVQTILDRLASMGELDNTIVIFTGDNGFSWGSHRYLYKHLPYEECSGVPLLIRWPGLGDNRVESRLVSNVDLAPTIAEMAAAIPRRVMDGNSLAPMIENPQLYWDEAVLLQRSKGEIDERFFGIRVPGWMYAEYANGDRELYDLTADPYELDNVVGMPAFAPVVAQMKARMTSLLADEPRPMPTPTSTAATPTSTPTPNPLATGTPTPTATATRPAGSHGVWLPVVVDE